MARRTLAALGVALALGVAGAGEAAAKPKPVEHAPPGAPASVAAADPAEDALTVSWQPADVAAVSYGVYVDGKLVASSAQPTFRLGGLGCGKTYAIAVDAVDATGSRSPSTRTTATTSSCTIRVAPDGSDANPCTRAAPCASFDRAYRLAAPGQTILIGRGTYPAQTIRVDPSKVDAPADVVFRPAPGATVDVAGNLVMYGSHAVFAGSPKHDDFKLRKLVNEGTAGPTTSNHVTFENLDGESFGIGPNRDITIRGGDWGPSVACFPRGSATDPASWCPADGPYALTGNDGNEGNFENVIGPDGDIASQWPERIVLDGLTIHDQNSLDLDRLHTGGLFLISGGPITIRNTKFSRNAVYQIQVQNFTDRECCGMDYGPVHDATLENNWFAPPVRGLNDPGGASVNDDQPEVQLDPRGGACWRNWLVRFNSFHNGLGVNFDADACFDNFRIVGNLGGLPAWQCVNAPGLTWEYNAWWGGTCGAATDVAIPTLPFRDTTVGHEDYHLTGGAAVDLVPGTDPDQTIATDIDGQSRPIGRARDAGADESR
jgi:hypothetical protein